MTALTDTAADLAAYTRGVLRARQEYRDHPFTRCPGDHTCAHRLGINAAASQRWRDKNKESK